MKEIIYINDNSILNKVKEICLNTLKENDYAIDMTIGNGLDTLFLCNTLKKGKVFGFDIQQIAIENTTKLLNEHKKKNFQIFLESHENVFKTLQEYQNKISIILFNLGYLPKADKSIMTNHKSTLKALQNSFKMLKENGKILIVCYPHEEGKKEAEAIKTYLENNNINYKEYRNTTKEFAPFLIVIEDFII